MNLSIQDGRAELWQWDTGVRLVMDEACEAVNLSEDTFGVTVDVTAAEDGKAWVAAVPDEMLQKPGDLICYAVQSTATGTITAAYRSFRVNRRPKPAGYVATPSEARTWQKLDDKKIDAPQVAQVGQIVKVKAVDADGKITETEAVDMPNRLDVTVSMIDGNFMVSHKFAEIKAAYDAGRAVQLIDIDTSRKYSLMGFFPSSIEGVTYADFRFIDGAGDIWKATINSNDEIDFFQDGTFITLYGDIPTDTPKAITYSVVSGIGYADFIPYIEIPSTGDELKERLIISPEFFYVMPNAYAPFAMKNLVNPYTLTRLSYSEPEFGTEDNIYEASYLVTDSLGQQIKATCQVLLAESGLGDLVWNFEVRDTLILKSSTEGSTKKFKITVDDSGTMSATKLV